MANRMAEAGLLTRRRDDFDKRLVRLHLTPAGRRLRRPVDAELELVDQRLTEGLTKTERRTLLTLLAKVSDNGQALLTEWDKRA
jgi:DNA-binding MarR family transcriptional regulator